MPYPTGEMIFIIIGSACIVIDPINITVVSVTIANDKLLSIFILPLFAILRINKRLEKMIRYIILSLSSGYCARY